MTAGFQDFFIWLWKLNRPRKYVDISDTDATLSFTKSLLHIRICLSYMYQSMQLWYYSNKKTPSNGLFRRQTETELMCLQYCRFPLLSVLQL